MPNIGNFPFRLSPLSIPPSAFVPYDDSYDWMISYEVLNNRTSLEVHVYYAPVILPQGVTVSKLTLYGYRNDALAVMMLTLRRVARDATAVEMASITAGWTIEWDSAYDDTIGYATIDNENYSYVLEIELDPNDDVGDVRFSGAKIEFRG